MKSRKYESTGNHHNAKSLGREDMTMKKPMEDIAQQISRSLAVEMGNGSKESVPKGILQLLVQQLAREVIEQLKDDSPKQEVSESDHESRIQRLERMMEGEDEKEPKDSQDQGPSTHVDLPNLKYAHPKYKDVESVLKYIERDGEQGGMKLVIMNFND